MGHLKSFSSECVCRCSFNSIFDCAVKEHFGYGHLNALSIEWLIRCSSKSPLRFVTNGQPS